MSTNPMVAPVSIGKCALERGQQALREWTMDGTLLSEKEFLRQRHQTLPDLADAQARGEMFHVVLEGRAFYPATLARLPVAFGAELCRRLSPLTSVQKLIFLLRKHGALRGQTVLTSHSGKNEARILELADAVVVES